MGFSSIQHSEYNYIVTPLLNDHNFVRNNMSVVIEGKELLELQGFNVDWLWYDQIGLAGLCLLFLTLGYITLRLVKKEK